MAKLLECTALKLLECTALVTGEGVKISINLDNVETLDPAEQHGRVGTGTHIYQRQVLSRRADRQDAQRPRQRDAFLESVDADNKG